MPQVANSIYLTRTEELFYCKIKVKLPEHYGESLLNECFAIMQEVDTLYNSYTEGSYFNTINANAGQWVDTDFNTVQLLKVLKVIWQCTNGAFDPTAMPLIKGWGFYNDLNDTLIPSETEIETFLQDVDFSEVQIDGTRVKIGANQELITGAFIKAFAVDQVIARLKQLDVKEVLINAGGSSICALSTSEDHWRLDIPHPVEQSHSLLNLSLQNSSFSLSSTSKYDRLINGKRYSHILNSKTGYPSQSLQVGVLTDSAFLGDVLSTALFSIDAKDFNTVVEQLGKHYSFSAYHIDKQYQYYRFNPKHIMAL
ncbi:FAD:protein FMN transferase [Mangrovimonas cancribranchiae]|uniref:FAD:protein FMN transferase n=1 Tax=Mangrovimonas cancribranchiae TaxID=3080055 RepID=A0AAU6P4V0_9FLAO